MTAIIADRSCPIRSVLLIPTRLNNLRIFNAEMSWWEIRHPLRALNEEIGYSCGVRRKIYRRVRRAAGS